MTDEFADLARALHALPPWRGQAGFTAADWAAYADAARRVQRADPAVVEAALEAFSREVRARDEAYPGWEHESKPFLLMRMVFAIPEQGAEGERFSFKGWSNWPAPDAAGQVPLGWPVSWRTGRPELLASYEGSMGQPYAAVMEYRFLRERYPFRDLG